jgi:hypothetical protein
MRSYVLIDHDSRYLKTAKDRIQEARLRSGAPEREEGLMSLTDAERRVLQEIPVPQADDLELVFAVPQFVVDGATSRAAVGRCLEYAPRQGPYYADAAMALGLIQDDRLIGRSGRSLSLTAEGQDYVSLPSEEKLGARQRIVLNAPIVKYISSQLGVTRNGERVPFPPPPELLDEAKVAHVLETLGPTGSTTARRAHTLVSWLNAL